MSDTTNSTNSTEQALTGERADIRDALRKHRQFLVQTVRDLDDEQAGRRTTASELCLGGLIKHVTSVERGWAEFIVHGASVMPDFTALTEEDLARRADEFRMLPGETLAGVLEAYAEQGRGSDAAPAATCGCPTSRCPARMPSSPPPWTAGPCVT